MTTKCSAQIFKRTEFKRTQKSSLFSLALQKVKNTLNTNSRIMIEERI